MKHPTKQQVQVVIDTLKEAYNKSIEEVGKAPVNMMAANINRCGTPMCHGGYYAMIRGLNPRLSDYSHGAALIANDLGFEDIQRLIVWATDNPEIWGNEFGGSMFSASKAFTGKRHVYVSNLNCIITHWEGVQSRLPE